MRPNKRRHRRDTARALSGRGLFRPRSNCRRGNDARCYVYASTEEQRNRGGYSIGQMPTFEGLCLSYSPNGQVSWSHRYSSNWEDNRE